MHPLFCNASRPESHYFSSTQSAWQSACAAQGEVHDVQAMAQMGALQNGHGQLDLTLDAKRQRRAKATIACIDSGLVDALSLVPRVAFGTAHNTFFELRSSVDPCRRASLQSLGLVGVANVVAATAATAVVALPCVLLGCAVGAALGAAGRFGGGAKGCHEGSLRGCMLSLALGAMFFRMLEVGRRIHQHVLVCLVHALAAIVTQTLYAAVDLAQLFTLAVKDPHTLDQWAEVTAAHPAALR